MKFLCIFLALIVLVVMTFQVNGVDRVGAKVTRRPGGKNGGHGGHQGGHRSGHNGGQMEVIMAVKEIITVDIVILQGNVKFFSWFEIVSCTIAIIFGLIVAGTQTVVQANRASNPNLESSSYDLNNAYSKSYKTYEDYNMYDYALRLVLAIAALYGIYKILGFVIGIIVLIGLTIFILITAIVTKQASMLGTLIIPAIGFLFMYIAWYFLNIYWRAYKYLKEVKEFQERTNSEYPMGKLR